MNWKRFFALLLVLALLPALFGNAFAAGPKARTLTDADYAPIDALWAELDAVEQDAQTQSAQDGPDRTLAAAQAVAEAVTASDLYVDGTLQWRGAQFSFETTTGVTCAYSPRLRELARKAAGSSVETEAVEPQTSTTMSADITLIEPYYGLDSNFTMQYQNEVKKLAAATGGSLQVLKTTRATITPSLPPSSRAALSSSTATAPRTMKTRGTRRTLSPAQRRPTSCCRPAPA